MNTKRASRFAIKRATDPKPRAMACKRCTTVSSNACASSSAPHSQTTHCARSTDSPPPIFNTNIAQTGQSAKPIITRARCVIALALCNPSSAYYGRRVGRFLCKSCRCIEWVAVKKRSGSSCCIARFDHVPVPTMECLNPSVFFFLVNTLFRMHAWSRRSLSSIILEILEIR